MVFKTPPALTNMKATLSRQQELMNITNAVNYMPGLVATKF